MTAARQVLLVDDDPSIREALGQALRLADLEPLLAASFVVAKDLIHREFGGVIVSDIRMPGRDGFHLLEYVRKLDPELPVILLTGEGDIPMAVRGMTDGAFAFLEKPCSSSELLGIVKNGLQARTACLNDRRKAALAQEAEARNLVATVQSTDTKAAGPDADPIGLSARMAQVERAVIIEALQTHKGHATETAKALQLPRKTFYDKLARHNLRAEDYR